MPTSSEIRRQIVTAKQRELLTELPDPPSDGLFLKGARRRIADNLVAQGLARMVGAGWFNGASYVRTDAGRAALDERSERKRERCPICGGLNPGDASHVRCS